jgi:hypothetical protein
VFGWRLRADLGEIEMIMEVSKHEYGSSSTIEAFLNSKHKWSFLVSKNRRNFLGISCLGLNKLSKLLNFPV